jgi:ATP-dependent protease Clp ATPase subunit
MPKKTAAKCSFCGKDQTQVEKLIVATERIPVVSICNECVVVCNRILAQNSTPSPVTPNAAQSKLRRKR